MSEQKFEVDLTKVFPATVTRTVKDGQILCPTCSGVGLVLEMQGGCEFIVRCGQCHGDTVLTKCQHCEEYFNGGYGHRCEKSQEAHSIELALESERREQEKWDKAEKITLDEAYKRYELVEVGQGTYLPVDEVIDEIIDVGWEPGDPIPRVWGTTKTSLSVDTDDALRNRLDDLHEDAEVGKKDMADLETFLQEWCNRESVIRDTTTYWPDEKVAIVITEQEVQSVHRPELQVYLA